MRAIALVVLIACKGQDAAPAVGSGSGSAPVVVAESKGPFGTKVEPPGELAQLRRGMTFDEAARVAPKLVTGKDNEITIAGMKARVTFRDDGLDAIELTLPPGTDAELTKQWGPEPWLDPTTGWFASNDAGTLHFVRDMPDPALMTQGAGVLDQALRTLADPKLPVPKDMLDMGPKANPFKLSVVTGHVLVDLPIMSKRAALSSWLALLEQRWGAAKRTSAGHWTYAAPVKVDAHLSSLGDLELDLAPP